MLVGSAQRFVSGHKNSYQDRKIRIREHKNSYHDRKLRIMTERFVSGHRFSDAADRRPQYGFSRWVLALRSG